MEGSRFGRLEVVESAGSTGRDRLWKCLCDCGTCVVVITARLRSGHTRSCGCLVSEITAARNKKHGHTTGGKFSPEYHSWVAMISRCYNVNTKGYKSHGAKGVTVCDEWRESFLAFFEHMGPRPDGTTLDRTLGTEGYKPGNCRWANPRDQANNRANTIFVEVLGETKPLMEWCRELGVKRAAVRSRVEKGGLTYSAALVELQCKNSKNRRQKMNVHFSSNTDLWATPQTTYDALHKEFGFNLDPCSTHENAKCADHYTEADNGLEKDWPGVVFMNPPYGDPEFICKGKCAKKICVARGHHNTKYTPGIADWMKKANYEVSEKGFASVVVCLVPSRTDTKWWHDYVIAPGHEVRFLKGRLKFGSAKNSAPFPSAVVVMR